MKNLNKLILKKDKIFERNTIMPYLFILGCVLFTVYAQIIMKWRISQFEFIPEEFLNKMIFFLKLCLDPYIISSIVSGFIASIFWMAALAKLEISYAYPFTSASFVLVFILSVFLFNEVFSLTKIIGLLLIISGIIVTSIKLD